ncbi:DUF2849 domain-containing protein [Paracoccus sp. SCSIO 75233]|uniref:DUF2849 domain-containing protein n=1 Tax=Paracoccus sp. SCSIO 75233 TaxID=3017782 RepID=UPI0022F01F9C|nr:DUF2849 domain-containing protein [Paracoccus sp. SCSIO 75233]WBU52795.1 DUF2849 domain-containing protein [Paracoccus sp. SCSIO 75233]
MARKFKPVVISANDLFDGRVIYLTGKDEWADQLKEAELIVDEDRAKHRMAQALALSDHAVGVFLAPARPGADGKPEPGHPREAFRANGPSNYFHGKQAEA